MKTYPAPAKLNLFLHITNRRSDGYHNLQTIFQFIDLYDELTFKIRNDGVIHRSGGELPDDDLCVSAARALQQKLGTSQGAEIHLTKRIPVGAGLGGGSSDAATTLIGLNQLWKGGLSRSALAGIGLKLGADVPVFVYGQAAWAEGLGERLTPVPLDEALYVLIVPPVEVATVRVFEGFRLNGQLTPHRPMTTIRDVLSGQVRKWQNDLQMITIKHYPAVAAALDWLRQFGDARMTGSGSGLFLKVSNQVEAARILEQKPIEYQGFIVHGLNNHPLAL